MTDKKKHKHEEIKETQPEVEEAPENGNPLQVEIDALRKELEEANSKAAENMDGWLRAQAEFQNYKKRVERDNEIMYAGMKGDIVKKVLPVLDDLERALQNRPAAAAESTAWANGIELIARKLQTILENEGVTRIAAEGAPFDPNFHEAISNESAEGIESGHVIAVVQNGYMLGERVIRPAMVRVAQ
jgi:molecular chaperone GrpE